MRKIHTEALGTLGLKVEPYRVEEPGPIDGDPIPTMSGIALVREATGETVAVAEQVPRGWDGDGKWRVRRRRSASVEKAKPALAVKKTQREAVAEIIRRFVA